MIDTNNNGIEIIKAIARRVITRWESRGPTATFHEFFILWNQDSNEEQITALAYAEPQYAAYRDYYLCGKIELENGRV